MQPIDEGLSEIGIDCDTSFRVCHMQQSAFLVVLLYNGGKRTQQDNIAKAKRLATE